MLRLIAALFLTFASPLSFGCEPSNHVEILRFPGYVNEGQITSAVVHEIGPKETIKKVFTLLQEMEQMTSAFLPPPDLPFLSIQACFEGGRKVAMIRSDVPIDLSEEYAQAWLHAYRIVWSIIEAKLGDSPLTSHSKTQPAAAGTPDGAP